MPTLTGLFNDELTFDSQTKTVVSFRDGVLRYLGSELGLEPADKEFTVYRSPATIANAARLMDNLPITDEHVSLDEPPANPVGTVEDATMIDLFDSETDSTVAVRNRAKITDLIQGALETGKREASLGYGADLVPHDKYDFEQLEILPHHLAVVQAGRCGPACAFIDHKGDSDMSTKRKGQQAQKPADNGATNEDLSTVFTDAEGQPNLEQIVEIAQNLPMALRKLPADMLMKVLPQLQEIVAMAGDSNGSDDVEPTADEAGEGEAMEAEDMDKPDEEMTDEESEDKKGYADSTEFKDAVAAAVEKHNAELTAVIDKAQDFLDASYSYAGKTAKKIMLDALAVEHGETKFDDEELTVAFKLLKPSGSKLQSFGDGSPDAEQGRFSKHANKEY